MSIKLRLCPWVAAGACVVAAAQANAAPFPPVPPASFLNYHVSTARGLSEEVAADVVVRARLARHFGLSEPSLVEYVRRNLVETTLTPAQAGRYRVACIGASGREYWVSERLGAGTPVFALAKTRKPILKLVGGNPLVSSLPILQAKKPHSVSAPLLALALTAVPGQTMAASALLVDDETSTAVPDLTGYQFDGVGPVTGVGGLQQVLTGGGGSNFLPGLIGAAALFGLASGGHSRSAQADPVPAPEPGSVSALMLGTVGLAFLTVRAARRRKVEACPAGNSVGINAGLSGPSGESYIRHRVVIARPKQ